MEIPKIIKKNRDAIIFLDVRIPENNQTKMSIKGSGFLISKDGRFVTCAHVYQQILPNELDYLGALVPGKPDDKGLINYERYQVKLLDVDKENDIALMQLVSQTDFAALDIDRPSSIEEGEEVVFIGYPLATEMLQMGFGLTMATNKCIVSSVKRKAVDGSLHFYLVDTHINNGSSGSPLFSLNTGKVIGIVSARLNMAGMLGPNNMRIDIPASMGICRPARYIQEIIDKNK